MSSKSSPTTPHSNRTKRVATADSETGLGSTNHRKTAKVSRACDHCKVKKLKCTGTIPCNNCTKKGIPCQYDAQYRRGRPPTPPAATTDAVPRDSTTTKSTRCDSNSALQRQASEIPPRHSQHSEVATSRGAPGLETAEIEGQLFDPTSNLTFIHRAWKRLATQTRDTASGVLTGSEQSQPLMSAGDKTFNAPTGQNFMFLDQTASIELFDFYFDSCVVTYRVLNQQYCFSWLNAVLHNVASNLPLHNSIGHSKAAIIVIILAIASLRQHKISQLAEVNTDPMFLLQQSEEYFITASNLTAQETGLPRLESAQARILQVLYLLQTSRMNQAWYTFGSTVPIVSALGLHRRSARHRNGANRSPTADYIVSECRKRTFWVVYTIDKYLAVVFGRPRFYHDDDVDQEYPDRVNDEDMTPQGPALSEPRMDCHVDALIFHASIARIVENISREVYSLEQMANDERLAAAQSFARQLHEWRKALPPHLGTVRPSSLIPCFNRQSTALKLAYCHAIMHANRPFLLDHAAELEQPAMSDCVAQCISAAKMALQTVDRMFTNETLLFHALWWTPYVTFCALAVVYVWEIEQKTNGRLDYEDPSLFALAEQCQSHLAKAISSESASKRYSIIIEELRLEARHNVVQPSIRVQPAEEYQNGSIEPSNGTDLEVETMAAGLGAIFDEQSDSSSQFASNPLSQWQATDWLDLDSSAFGFFSDLEGSIML
ncbi:Fc.00g057120.m01.CDS01 [Cosmosporella sp. VM-42]